MDKYTYEETYKASLDYFEGNEFSAKVFTDKYALKDNEGKYDELSPHDLHIRIASEFARIEKSKFAKPMCFDEIFSYLDHFENIIPQGSPMYGIGNPYKNVTLSNCYVLESPYDSYGGILKTDQELVQISKRRGGVGLDISNLRPAGTQTRS